jgi:hypothetical protein
MPSRPFWENDEIVAPPAAQATLSAPAAPGAFYEQDQRVTAAPGYSGSILPISADAQGNPRFDANAGILGRIIGAFKAPGDVYTGKSPILVDDKPSPDLTGRAIDFASFFGPVGTVTRAAMPDSMSKPSVPTAAELKAAGAAGYDKARASGLDISGKAIANLSNDITQFLQGEHGVIPATAPKTYATIDKLAAPPEGGFVTISGLDAARRGLSQVSREGGTDGFASGHAVRRIDDFLSSLDDSAVAPSSNPAVSPQNVARILGDARGNYAAAMRSNALTGALDRAPTGIGQRADLSAAASNSGMNVDNLIRQQTRNMMQNPEKMAGFSQPEIDALRQVVEGGAVRNTARHVGNLLGGGGGLGQAVLAGMGAAAGGAAGGGPGAVAGAALPLAAGVAAKSLQNRLGMRDLNLADMVTRSNSPLYRDMLGAAPADSAPTLENNPALWRLLLGAMGPSDNNR